MSDGPDLRYGKDGRTYAEAIAARDQLADQELQIASSYDKHLLTLASGALAISIGFVEKIAQDPIWIILLFAAWSAFALCILANLLAILFAQASINRHGYLNRLSYEVGPDDHDTANPWQSRVEIANWLSLTFFVLGVLFIVVFSVVNQKGSIMSKPPVDLNKAAKGQSLIRPVQQPPQPSPPSAPQTNGNMPQQPPSPAKK